MIHPTAIVSPRAKLGSDPDIGPFCIIGDNIVLGDRVRLVSHVVLDGNTEIGDDSVVYPFAVLGAKGQDLKFQEDESMTGVKIGKRCKIREYATVNSGTPASTGTEIGDDCQIMMHAHVAHDCKIGNNVVLSNMVQIGGHVEIEDNAIVSAGTMVHQFVRIGRNVFIGGMSGLGIDAVPYAIYDGRPAGYRTINKVGLTRSGFTNEDLHAVHSVYSAVFGKFDDGSSVDDRLKKIRREVGKNKYAADALDFIENRSHRGVNNAHSA
ncbi:MAG: acyl-ACP--UDP-N-acetylglucosamine O-acyltransferase [Proteobacteria bacterium]|nr:acyl-ACP--UDP-N-acetylglucosamine O-acyltransferase [Pseudomonadota bacterium]